MARRKQETSRTGPAVKAAVNQPVRGARQLAGRLVSDPELRHTPTGKAACEFLAGLVQQLARPGFPAAECR
jgi:hypothetical protein